MMEQVQSKICDVLQVLFRDPEQPWPEVSDGTMLREKPIADKSIKLSSQLKYHKY